MIAQETIKTVPVADLVPTQMTVGMREVSFKRRRWRERSSRQAADYLNKLRIPVVLGPNARQYLIDRHHLILALRDEGIGEFTVSVVANLGTLVSTNSGQVLKGKTGLIHSTMRDGGVATTTCRRPSIACRTIPFARWREHSREPEGMPRMKRHISEFKWADFLRCRIPRELIERDFGRALAMAMHLAEGAEAKSLARLATFSPIERFPPIAAAQTVSGG